MKKQEKMDIISSAMINQKLCRCYFTYDENYYYYYVNAVNDAFILGQEEDDFLLNGYCIRKLSQLKKVEIKDDKCNAINKLLGVIDQIQMPDVDISSWKTIFDSLKALDRFIIIEDEINGRFTIGVIEETLKNKLRFKEFDADGIWSEENLEIPYSTITSVKWGTRYAKAWEWYFEKVMTMEA